MTSEGNARVFKVLLAFGTRPEAIKLAPVYREMKRRTDRIRLICYVTGQHRELLDKVLEIFTVRADHDLNIFKASQDLFHVTAAVLAGIKAALLGEKPDLLMVQGDTTSAFAAALAAFYLQIPIAHVEAGLRSYDRFQPFPEEVNRRFISLMADLNFCPTKRAAENLLAEKIDPFSIHVTGNTGIDALIAAMKIVEAEPDRPDFRLDVPLPPGRMILVTGHRRENFGKGLANLALALVDLATKYKDVSVVYSMHPNPNVRREIERILKGHERIFVIPPPDYFRFITLMKRCFFIVTDSGGIQEEAPSVKKPVLVARTVTERPEVVETGAAILVGSNRDRIVEEASRLLEDPAHYSSMIARENPFGDGHASERIVDTVEQFLISRVADTKGDP